jgi:hypothetical protein
VADNQINGQTNGQINGPGRGHQAAGELNGVTGETGTGPPLIVGPCYGLDYHLTMPKVTLMLPTSVEPP